MSFLKLTGVFSKKRFLEISLNSKFTFNFTKSETLAQAFPCEFCEISKNTFFAEHVRWLLLKIFYSCRCSYCWPSASFKAWHGSETLLKRISNTAVFKCIFWNYLIHFMLLVSFYTPWRHGLEKAINCNKKSCVRVIGASAQICSV